MTKTMRDRLAAFIRWYARFGLSVRITSTDRTFAEQDKLFAQGKTKLRGGQSLHNFGLAADVIPGDVWPDVSRSESFAHLAAVGTLLGFQAVQESDHVHLELDPRPNH